MSTVTWFPTAMVLFDGTVTDGYTSLSEFMFRWNNYYWIVPGKTCPFTFTLNGTAMTLQPTKDGRSFWLQGGGYIASWGWLYRGSTLLTPWEVSTRYKGVTYTAGMEYWSGGFSLAEGDYEYTAEGTATGTKTINIAFGRAWRNSSGFYGTYSPVGTATGTRVIDGTGTAEVYAGNVGAIQWT